MYHLIENKDIKLFFFETPSSQNYQCFIIILFYFSRNALIRYNNENRIVANNIAISCSKPESLSVTLIFRCLEHIFFTLFQFNKGVFKARILYGFQEISM